MLISLVASSIFAFFISCHAIYRWGWDIRAPFMYVAAAWPLLAALALLWN